MLRSCRDERQSMLHLLGDLGAMEHVLEALQLEHEHIRRLVNGQSLQCAHQPGLHIAHILRIEETASRACPTLGNRD